MKFNTNPAIAYTSISGARRINVFLLNAVKEKKFIAPTHREIDNIQINLKIKKVLSMEHNNDIQSDILPLALMFTILVYLLFIYPTQIIKGNKTYSELLEAKKTAIYYYDLAYAHEEAVMALNASLDEKEYLIAKLQKKLNDPELSKLIKIKEDLRSYSLEEKATGIAIGWTEGSFQENPNHKDNGFTQGPCGVTEYHVDYLHSLGLNRFSYASCIEIYKLYKDKNSGSKELAIKSYKGIKQNTYLIEKYNSVRARVIKILKE